MPDITVTFEDGAVERLAAATTAEDALRAHAERAGSGKKALKRAVAACVETAERQVVDLSRPLTEDCRLTAVGPDTPEGLEVLRHSCAHLMAQAVQRIFPGTQITIGPVIDHGFYYDFKRPEGFTPEDLERIESTMRAIVQEDLPVTREERSRADAVALFRDMGEHYKVEIIEGLEADVVSRKSRRKP
jgi:threonyl-tRNA synthetase